MICEFTGRVNIRKMAHLSPDLPGVSNFKGARIIMEGLQAHERRETRQRRNLLEDFPYDFDISHMICEFTSRVNIRKMAHLSPDLPGVSNFKGARIIMEGLQAHERRETRQRRNLLEDFPYDFDISHMICEFTGRVNIRKLALLSPNLPDVSNFKGARIIIRRSSGTRTQRNPPAAQPFQGFPI